MFSRILLYLQLIRIEKPIGYMLVIWPTLCAIWLAAKGFPGWTFLIIFTVGAFLMHSAGCAINDFADRQLDRFVKRTAKRPLTSGKIKPWEAIAVAAFLSLIALFLVLQLNFLTLELSIVAVIFAASYPWFKRFFPLPQAYLGIAFGFCYPMAFAAIVGNIPVEAWILMLANAFWTLAYDTQYAMVDKDDDLKIGIKSSAITFGQYDVLGILVSYGVMILVYAFVGYYMGLKWGFFLGLASVLVCVIYQYPWIKTRQRKECFLAFRFNNVIGAFLFAGICLDYFLR